MAMNPLPTLPLILQWMQMNWLGLNSALPPVKPVSPCSKRRSTDSLAEETGSLSLDHGKLLQAMSEQLIHSQSQSLNGIAKYAELSQMYAKVHAAYARATPYPTIWQEGTTRLRDYAPERFKPTSGKKRKDKGIVLLIPSLINKHHIFDLHDGHSFTRYLNTEGYRPMVVDWGRASVAEHGFDCLHYITRRLCPMLEHLREAYPDTPIFVLGYCLGGILAMGLAQLRSSLVQGVTLLATPWDYAAQDSPVTALPIELRAQFEVMIKAQPVFPAELMQSIFHWLQPSRGAEKFAYFSQLKDRKKIDHFLAVEHWVNDGIPLTREVANECLLKWPQENSLMRGTWPDSRQPLSPESFPLPSLCVIPENDIIVPYHCAMGLFDQLENCTLVTPKLGHVGLLASKKAKQECWAPIIKWLNNYS